MTDARFLPRIADLPAAQWDALRPDDNPFTAHAFLDGLERHGCVQPRLGWTPHHLALEHDGRLQAVAPCYLKVNSHGEFVFDHAWAEAYWRHGIDYYPKLICAVPYSPVSGPRLLAGADPRGARRQACLDAIRDEVARLGLSSAHINFDCEGASDPAWLERIDWQFHWHDRGWRDFEAFLAALSAKKRKNIRQERAQVQRAGIRFRWVDGRQASERDLDDIHDFYRLTFAEKGNLAVLTPGFLRHLAETMPDQFLLVLAERGGRAIAGALFLRSSSTLYGRYWGCREPLPGLHFETCYYQGIEYCLAQGLRTFEPGAQGEHKLARGFLPCRTRSLHHLADRRFHAAVGDALGREAAWRIEYRQQLLAHSPYRADLPPAD